MTWFLKTGLCSVMVALCVLPNVVSAHATPITYTPAAGATELITPGEIVIYFTERIELRASSIKVFAPDGTEVQMGSAKLNETDPRIFSIPIQNGGDGVYTVVWQVVSVDDGHFTKGSFSFLVAEDGRAFEGQAEGTTQVTYTTKFSDAVIGLVGLIGEAPMIGVLAVYIFVARPLRRMRPALSDAVASYGRVYVWLASVGVLLLSASTLSTILRKTMELSSLRDESLLTSLTVFVDSVGGVFMVYKMLAALLFLVTILLFRKQMFSAPRITWVECVLALTVGIIIFFQSKVSHAAASFFYPQLSVWVTAGHLLFKELLVGGVVALVPLYALIARRGASLGSVHALALYDRLAALAILLAGLTGTYITWLHLKRFEALVATEWGERFMLLLVFGVLIGAFRVLHQFILGPLSSIRPGLTHIIRATLMVEIVMGVLMLFYSGYIAITTPPFTIEQYAYTTSVEAGNALIELDVHPYERGQFRVQLFESDGVTPMPLENLVVFVSNPARSIEANVVTPIRRSSHSFVFPESTLSPAGAWDIKVVAQHMGAYDTNASFHIEYPDDILATRYSDEVRAFDDFAHTMSIVAGVIVLFSLVLLIHAHVRVRRSASVVDTHLEARESVFPHTVVAVVLSLLVCVVVLGVTTRVIDTDFKSQCLADGFLWKQAFPARDYEVVAPNSVVGCWVHDGHYHMPDYAEYLYHLDSY